jgi:hypothetical protein
MLLTSTVVSAIALATAASPLGSTANAAPAQATRYVGLVLGNSHYLVHSPSNAARTAGRYPHVLNKSGDRHKLSGVPAGFELTNVSLQRNWLVGEAESASTGVDGTKAYWWNVKTRASGTTAIPDGGELLGAVPGGFVYVVVNTVDSALWRYYREDVSSGTSAELPKPSGTLTRVVVGAQGLVGYRNTKPTMTYVPYNGKHSTNLKAPVFPDNLRFATISSDYLSAVDDGGDGQRQDGVMIPLNGDKATIVPGSRGYQIRHKILFGKNHPKWLLPSGEVTKSKVKGSVVGTAFRTALVLNDAGTKLRSVARAKSMPKTLVTTR